MRLFSMRARFLDFLVRSAEGAVASREFSSGVAGKVGASVVDGSSILVSSSVDVRDGLYVSVVQVGLMP